MLELHQPEYTHKTVHHSEVVSLGRLDRIYMSIPTSDVLDLSPLTGLMGDLLDPKLPSDHTCVFVSLTSTP
eukprot:6361105-Pyramimonas_sp.AAC.1